MSIEIHLKSKKKYILISSFATESSVKERIMGRMEEGSRMTQHNDHRPADESLETRYYTSFDFFKSITNILN